MRKKRRLAGSGNMGMFLQAEIERSWAGPVIDLDNHTKEMRAVARECPDKA